MKKILILIFMGINQCINVCADELNNSGRTEIWDNPFIAYGYNPETKIATGYMAASRIAPGRTDECKLAFAGSAFKKNKFSVKYIGRKLSSEKLNRFPYFAFLVVDGNISYLKFSRKNLGGDCEWILPFVIESETSENTDEISVEMNVQHAGEWIAVYVIDVQKASFHSRPDSSTVEKAFVVKGDVIYVYDEKPDWYFVKYRKGKSETEGWIRKSDTLQP